MSRGIVICAGGAALAKRAADTISVLRSLGCMLPVELWHLSSEAPAIVAGTSSHDGGQHCNGWALKPHAVQQSEFSEVLLLDAGLRPLADPTPFFDNPAMSTGAMFWPDSFTIRLASPIWDFLGMEPRRVAAWDSGQIVIDKMRCEPPLAETVALNTLAVHRIVYGDKDTWLLGWLKTNSPFSLCPFGPDIGVGGWRQHVWSGNAAFWHEDRGLSANGRDKPGLSADTYDLRGVPVHRVGASGIAQHVASGIRGSNPIVDRTTPLSQRRDRHGRLRK